MRIMSRFIVAGILGLSLAGCAQTKTGVSKDAPPPVPVAITPVPSIYESINRGTGGRKVQQTTMKDITSPLWAGQATGPVRRDAAARAMAASAKPNGGTAPRILASAGGGAAIAAADASTGAPKVATNPSEGAPAPTASAGQNPQAESATVAGAEPTEAPASGGSTNPVISANGLLPVSELPAEPGAAPGSADSSATRAEATSPATESSGLISATAQPKDKEQTGPETASSGGDPLLGPNPNLMPVPADLPKVSVTRLEDPAASPAASPAAPAVDATKPAAEPAEAPKSSEPDGASAAPSNPGADPLLGPNPVLMPMPGPAEIKNGPGSDPAKNAAETKSKEELPALEPVAPAVAAPELSTPAPAPAGGDPSKVPGTPEPLKAPSEAAPELAKPSEPALQPAAEPAKPAAGPTSPPAEEPAAEPAAEAIPLVGTAKDEHGEEFGLPQLPAAGLPLDSPPAQDSQKLEPGPIAPKMNATESLPPLPDQPAGSPSALNAKPAPGAAVAGTPPSVDPTVRQASVSPAEVKTPQMSRNVKEAGRAAAGVGDEVITLNDLVATVKEFRKKHPSQQPPSKEELNMMGKGILMMLIERSLLTQEAKRVLKNPKMLEQLMSYAEKSWNDEELPPLMRKYFAANIYELKEKMAADNRSLDAIHESHRQDFLAQAFLQQKIGNKLKVELPEMLKYYKEHANDRENHRPASITWREILIETSKYPSPQEARNKAQKLVERLRKGEKFATLAKTESDGPNLTKSAGGLMETSPGSYGVVSVNQAIESLPINKVSEILEGPTSLHIVVVENRRAAGPATFQDLQDQIRKTLYGEKVQKERVDLITKLRKQTIVWTIFDNTASDPNQPN